MTIPLSQHSFTQHYLGASRSQERQDINHSAAGDCCMRQSKISRLSSCHEHLESGLPQSDNSQQPHEWRPFCDCRQLTDVRKFARYLRTATHVACARFETQFSSLFTLNRRSHILFLQPLARPPRSNPPSSLTDDMYEELLSFQCRVELLIVSILMILEAESFKNTCYWQHEQRKNQRYKNAIDCS
jgi:hypothetical protein